MGNFKRVYKRNFIVIATVLFLCFFLMGMVFTLTSYQIVVSDKEENMVDSTENIANFISSYLMDRSVVDVKGFISWMGQDVLNVDIMITDHEGVVVLCSDDGFNCEHIGKSVTSRILDQIDEEGMINSYEFLSETFGSRRYIVGTTLEYNSDDGVYAGYLFLSGNGSQLTDVWRVFSLIFLLVGVCVVAIGFMVSFFISKRQARPLSEMTAAAKKFSHGDFSVRVHETGRSDELGELAYTFNKMADALENSDKTRSELIANVSHELKTPMTTITGFADGILDGTIPPEKEKEYLAVISSETKRLSRLVRGMLDISQEQEKGTLVKKTFDIAEIIRVALISLEQKITSRDLDVDVNLPEDTVMVLGVEDSITQVVYNLIDNAAKFAAQGSTIRMELWKSDGKAYVSIANEGDTISKEELPLIFDRFHKSDRSRSMDKEGVGLGLYIVKTILDSHGEDVFVTSRDGVTKFTFTVTLASEGGESLAQEK